MNENERYQRQVSLKEFGEKGQQKLLPLTFKNSLTKGKVKLIKEDDVESSKALAGAVFTLQDATGKEIMKDLTTDDYGVLVIPDLAPGDCVMDNFNNTCSNVTVISHREYNVKSYFAKIHTKNTISHATYNHLIQVSLTNNIDDVNKNIYVQITDLNIRDLVYI